MMNMTNDEMSMEVIEQLRGMTEEIDFNQFLKKAFGGYTKKSVLDYLSMLRKQQQATSETFYKNLQLVFHEKEDLQSTIRKLQARIQKLESEYRNLSDAMQNYHPENEELTLSNMISLQNMINTKEEEVKRLYHEKLSLESKLDQLDKTNIELSKTAEQAKNESSAQKELLKTLKQELKKQYDTSSDLSSQLEIERVENKYLKGKATETKAFQLTQKINDLTEQLALQSELIAIKNEEIIQKDHSIVTLNQVIETLKQNSNSLGKVMEEINAQNDRLLFSNQAFTKMLEEEFVNTVALVNEKSYVNRERIAALKLLDEANSKINMLELQLEKEGKVIELTRITQQNTNLKEELAK